MLSTSPTGTPVHDPRTQAREVPARSHGRRVSKKTQTSPLISVIVLNYNGAAWLDRCLSSLAAQTLASNIEVIIADNASTDFSDLLAADLMRGRPGWRMIRHDKNLGYCAGNNQAAREAHGRHLLFLNTDTWLEPDCLERLLEEVRNVGATAATPLVMDYQNDVMQSAGESGFDLFGLLAAPVQWSKTQEILVANGPALFVDADWFWRLGGFDAEFFMYADEYDLCWRIWQAGGKVVVAPSARMHHRGAAAVNPQGGEQIIESRTSDTKRFYANRNGLLVLLKNCQHLLLVMVPLQLMMLAAEVFLTSVLSRRSSHFHRAYLDVIRDCWRLRGHILNERQRQRAFRRHGDFWMLRFIRSRFNRWREFQRILRFGRLKVDLK